jgi:predicted DCC family thiol-disulfide oxidoreductase YuxK
VSAPVILFDGVCGLCNAWIDFVLRHDRRAVFRLAPLQSDAGQRVLLDFGLRLDYTASIVLVTSDGVLVGEAAVCEILRRLGGIWRLSAAAVLVPRGIREWAYEFIAARRYRWFGRKDVCRIPTPAERARFL